MAGLATANWWSTAFLTAGGSHTSLAYQAVLAQFQIQVSMSGKGDCYDNALMESFFGTLKTECVDRQSFASRVQARLVIFEYLEGFYNRQREPSRFCGRGKAGSPYDLGNTACLLL